MALTKPGKDIDGCQEVAASTLHKGNEEAIAADFDGGLYIQLALTDETAHTGTDIIVQINRSDDPTNTDWVTLDNWTALIGTANQEALSGGGEGIGDTVIEVADTTAYVTNGEYLFIEDTTTFADSEWVMQETYVVNTSITIVDGLAVAKDNADVFSNVAQCMFVQLPFSARQVRVIYNNLGNSTIAIRCGIVEVTAVS